MEKDAANFVIRKIRKQDGKAIRDIVASIAQHSVSEEYEKLAAVESKRRDAGSFVAEADGKIIGFVISYELTGAFGIEKSAWVALIGIDPEYMDQGVGKSLAEEIFKFYKKKGIFNIFTFVKWDSTDMLSYFKTLGFDRSSYINLVKTIE